MFVFDLKGISGWIEGINFLENRIVGEFSSLILVFYNDFFLRGCAVE